MRAGKFSRSQNSIDKYKTETGRGQSDSVVTTESRSSVDRYLEGHSKKK